MKRNIVSIRDLTIDAASITAVHLAGSGRGIVIHHSGMAYIVDTDDDEQARGYLSTVANAMNGEPFPPATP
jgi:hypothetical protein